MSCDSTYLLTPQASYTPFESANSSRVMLTPESSDTGSDIGGEDGVLLTSADSANSLGEWPFLMDGPKLNPATTSVSGSSAETVTYENLAKIGRAGPCGICPRKFKIQGRLLQHLNSLAHAPKIFHCPTASMLGLAVWKPGKAFKTLSGFTQHVEAGACDGGVDLLKNFIDICQNKGKTIAGKGPKLIAGGG